MNSILCGSADAAYQLLKEMSPRVDKVAVIEYFPDSTEVFAYQFFEGETNIATFIPSQSSLILQDRPYSLSREHTHIFKD